MGADFDFLGDSTISLNDSVFIPFRVIDDAILEGTEDFSITLQLVDNAGMMLINNGPFVITIDDNECKNSIDQ